VVLPEISLMAAERHEHRDYRIVMGRQGGGWRATIYAPDSQQPILGPRSDDPTGHNDVLEWAKRFIDSLIGS
jgi:hypothetical protein